MYFQNNFSWFGQEIKSKIKQNSHLTHNWTNSSNWTIQHSLQPLFAIDVIHFSILFFKIKRIHWERRIFPPSRFLFDFSVSSPWAAERRSGSPRTNSIPAEGAGSETPSDLRELLESEEQEIRLPRHLLCRAAPNLCGGNNKRTEGRRAVNGTPGRVSWIYNSMLHKSSLSLVQWN